MSGIFNTKSARTAFAAGAFSAAVLCTALRAVATLFFFDSDIGYYQSGKIIPILSYIVPIAAIAAALLICFVPKIKLTPLPSSAPLYTRICAALPALGFAAFSAIYILSLVEYSDLQSQIPFSFILCAICSVVSCVFFVFKALGKQASAASVICGILTLIWLVLALAQNYFDTFMTMNSPIKTAFQFACLAAMLFILCEMRTGIDTKRTQLQLFSTAAAVILLPLSAIPSLIGFALDKMPLNYNLVYYDAVLLSVAVFAAVRLVNLCFGKERETTTEVSAVQDIEQQSNCEEITDGNE